MRSSTLAALVLLLAFSAAFLLFSLIGNGVGSAADAAASVVTAFALVFLTMKLVDIEHRREKQADEMETARLRVVAGKWDGSEAELYITNSGWKPSAVEQAWMFFQYPAGGGTRTRISLIRDHADDDERHNIVVSPGERVRFRGIPFGSNKDQLGVFSLGAQHYWVELSPVLGEPSRVDIKPSEFPRE